MKPQILPMLACPKCGGDLLCHSTEVVDAEIRRGTLECGACAASYPIEEYIPRFVPRSNYAASFGFEWHRHARTQVDQFNGTTLSADRFFGETGWPRQLAGRRMLEVGCGAGRFTQVAAETGAELFSFDYSDAVDVALQNTGLRPNLHLFQADIYHPPFKPGQFDAVFCLGVIQHTPDPAAAFRSLVRQVACGGRLAVDVYSKTRATYLKPKYAMRGITKRMNPHRLYRLVATVVPRLVPVKAWLKRVPRVGRYAHKVIPICYYGGIFSLTPEQHVEWAVLDTFDMLSPQYDKPQSYRDFHGWFRRAGLQEIVIRPGTTGYIGRARRAPGGR